MLPLDLSTAQVYQYTSGVPSAHRFRSLASVATKAKAQLPSKTHVMTTKAKAQLPLKSHVMITAQDGASLPVKAAAKENVHSGAVAEPGIVAARDLGTDAEQKPLAEPAKVSREWYVDDVVER